MAGCGRGSILRKMLDITNPMSDESIGTPVQTPKPGLLGSIGRGTSLMTPSQFMRSTPSGPSGKKNIQSGDKDSPAGNKDTPTATITPKNDLSSEENMCSKEMCHLNLRDSDEREMICNKTNVTVSEQKSNHELQPGINVKSSPSREDYFCISEAKAPVPVEKDALTEDQEWKLYQVERNITKILKNVTVENLGDVFQALESLVEDRPLSSCYTNYSEVEQLLDVLFKNAVQNDEFLSLAPCIIKMISEHQPIEFKRYFPEICDAKCQEYVTLTASDEHLNKYGKNFCQLLGHLFAMPRQTGPTFFNIVSPVIEEYVEKWTCPEGVEIAGGGLNEHMLAVDATAVRCMLLEITRKMLPCDREVEKGMEKFVWFVRESILNAKVPKGVREIFLDGLIEIQTTSGDGSSTTHDINSQSESEADISFEIETDIDGNQDNESIQDKIRDHCEVSSGMEESKAEADKSSETIKDAQETFSFVDLQPPVISTENKENSTQIYNGNVMVPKCVQNNPAMTYSGNSKTKQRYSGGYGKMAMSFPCNESQNSEDSDPDIIIEDQYVVDDDDDDDTRMDSEKTLEAITNSDKFTENINSFETAGINNFVNTRPLVSNMQQPKKLPLGRGRGLVRIPDFDASGYAQKPIANVNPIGYSSRVEKNYRNDSIGYSGNNNNNPSGYNNNPSGYNNNNPSGYNNNNPSGYNNNPSGYNNNNRVIGNYKGESMRSERNFRSGGRDTKTDYFQQRGRGSGNRRNYPSRNGSNNFPQNNMKRNDRGDRHGNFNLRNDTCKQKKPNFRPVYHQKNTLREDEKQDKPPSTLEFGSIIPKTCLRCNSSSHLGEDCPVENIFF